MIRPEIERDIADLISFLVEKEKIITDRDVTPIFHLRYKKKMNVSEYSSLLCALEEKKLLDKERCVNKGPFFYHNMHKNMTKFLNEKH